MEIAPLVKLTLIIFLAVTINACGGGGGGGSSSIPSSQWQSGVFSPSQNFAAKCAAPRSGTDPLTQAPYPDTQGSALTENQWLRSWTNELYLWYDEVVDTNPSGYATKDYFKLLKTNTLLPSGLRKDRFHFTYPTADWEALSLNGIEPSYGVRWAVISKTPPRKILVGYIEPNAPSTLASTGLMRGTEILTADGIDIVNVNDEDSINKINDALSPLISGETHTFVVRDSGAATTRTVVLQAASITTTPVQQIKTISTVSGNVGYLLFNDHIATAESELIDAINTLKTAAITDLILDLRYNGGGYLDIASELAYMIAGPSVTNGAIFEEIHFNAKYPGQDPVTHTTLSPTPFHDTTQGFSTTAGQPLPILNLPRVFVLTGLGTCSASESVINGLRGVNIQVIQIGSTTCGKPYGFYPQDNCGTTYFTIELQGTNALGFGEYEEGFAPNNDSSPSGVKIPGCSVADDLSHALGDSAEGRLAAALNYRLTQQCPTPATGIAPKMLRQLSPLEGVEVELAPWRENRILK